LCTAQPFVRPESGWRVLKVGGAFDLEHGSTTSAGLAWLRGAQGESVRRCARAQPRVRRGCGWWVLEVTRLGLLAALWVSFWSPGPEKLTDSANFGHLVHQPQPGSPWQRAVRSLTSPSPSAMCLVRPKVSVACRRRSRSRGRPGTRLGRPRRAVVEVGFGRSKTGWLGDAVAEGDGSAGDRGTRCLGLTGFGCCSGSALRGLRVAWG
jgi:hypothetical protein